MFFKAMANEFALGDITGYPKTINKPFSQSEPYNFVTCNPKRQYSKIIEINAGIF